MNIICFRNKTNVVSTVFVYNKELNRKIRKRSIGKFINKFNRDKTIEETMTDKFVKRACRIPIKEEYPNEVLYKYTKCMNKGRCRKKLKTVD